MINAFYLRWFAPSLAERWSLDAVPEYTTYFLGTLTMQKTKDLNPTQFATIAANLLNQGLLEAGRTAAKRIFRELEEGRRVTLTKLKMEDGGLTRIDLSLDYQAFQGSINYSAFRDGVLALVARLSDTIREGKGVQVFQAIDDNQQPVPAESFNTRLFAVGGLTVHDGTPNVLMLGVQPSRDQPVVTLQLMYVDPNQFKVEDQSAQAE